jgi:predicted ribosome quality control (RQC) complex YloA/Tae2 family protein
MSLRPVELAQVCAELAVALRGAVVQGVFCPAPGLCFLELRLPGRSVLLCLSAQAEVGRLSIVAARPPSPAQASTLQQVLRRDLVGARLAAIRHEEGTREVTLDWEKPGRALRLHLELSGTGALVFTGADERVLAVYAAKERGLRAGGRYAAQASSSFARSSSRLVPDPASSFPFAEAAERLFAGKDVSRRADTTRRALTAPLRAKLARTARTLDKVRAEAARQPEAELHRQAGELVSRNLHLLTRGAREVRLTEYTAEGPVERVVPLDPALPPKAQAERHFHQYKRLLRGCEHAGRRLAELSAEHARLLLELARLEAAPDEALAAESPAGALSPKKPGPSVASPFREYRSSKEARILVGKHAAGNDALTFDVANAHDLWLHARGVPGSHVVIPLAKGAELPQELLLDAAHLAVHHSDAKAEPRAEVSYTPVKFVHRLKGGAPGQVTFTREKTLLVRLEPARLRRLLDSVVAQS